jgi:hypothetical protein
MLRLTTCLSVKRQRQLPTKLAFMAVLLLQVYCLVLSLRPNPKDCLISLRLGKCMKIRLTSTMLPHATLRHNGLNSGPLHRLTHHAPMPMPISASSSVSFAPSVPPSGTFVSFCSAQSLHALWSSGMDLSCRCFRNRVVQSWPLLAT